MRSTRITLVAAAALALTAACGSGAGDGREPLAKAAYSKQGAIVVDSSGHTLYVFRRDTPGSGRSECYDECARQWPVLAAQLEVPVSANLTGAVGSIVRADGSRQMTLNGWPLYRFAGDTAPGELSGHRQDGSWFAVSPAGALLP